MTTARDRAKQRRQKADEAEQAYAAFLEQLAAPLARQLVNALRAEGYALHRIHTWARAAGVTGPGRDDFVELALNTDTDPPHVVGHVRRTRGSRTIDEERPIKPGRRAGEHQRRGVLEFLAVAIEPWLEALSKGPFGSWRLGVELTY